jgi:ribonuclease-3
VAFLPLRRCKSLLLLHSRSKDGELTRALKGMLGYTPVNLLLYKTALTHSSLARSGRSYLPVEHNERMEFLGDAVIGAVVSEFLYLKFPEQREGFLTQLRSKIVARESLSHLALAIGLDALIKAHLNRPFSRNVVGNTLEALMGAIYLDKGYACAKKTFLQRIFLPQVNVDELTKREFDYKSRLLEVVQRKGDRVQFETQEEQHGEVKKGTFFFSSTLRINDEVAGSGSGSSKKEAEQRAAEQAYGKLTMNN